MLVAAFVAFLIASGGAFTAAASEVESRRLRDLGGLTWAVIIVTGIVNGAERFVEIIPSPGPGGGLEFRMLAPDLLSNLLFVVPLLGIFGLVWLKRLHRPDGD